MRRPESPASGSFASETGLVDGRATGRDIAEWRRDCYDQEVRRPPRLYEPLCTSGNAVLLA